LSAANCPVTPLGALIDQSRRVIDLAVEIEAVGAEAIYGLITAYRGLKQVSAALALEEAEEKEEERRQTAKACGWTDISAVARELA
jgi:hypothetical protein